MSWCASGVVLHVLPFVDNNHLGSILSFQRFSCLICTFFFQSNSSLVLQANLVYTVLVYVNISLDIFLDPLYADIHSGLMTLKSKLTSLLCDLQITLRTLGSDLTNLEIVQLSPIFTATLSSILPYQIASVYIVMSDCQKLADHLLCIYQEFV